MHLKQLFAITIITITGAITLMSQNARAAGTEKPAILVTGFAQNGMNFLIDPVLEAKLTAQGYRIASMDAGDLTPQKLRLFDEVILLQEYVTGDWATGRSLDFAQELEAKLANVQKMLLKYVEDGGGLFIFFDELHYEGDWDYEVNALLAPLDASVTRENFGDKNPENVHIFPLLQGDLAGYRAGTVARHPVTEGVEEFWFPGSCFAPHSGTLKPGPEWKVLIASSKTSFTEKTYKNGGMPVLAVREYGKGRVALINGLSSYYVNNGYHRAYENGWMFEKGQGMRLFTNAFDWLGAHPADVKIGGYKKGMFPPMEPLAWRIDKTPYKEMKAFPGVFGVYTSHSGGDVTVDQFCAKAKELGLKFVVFTDKIRTAAAWNEFKAECAKNTTADFVAIPGVEWRDVYGNEGCAVNIDSWPPSEGLGKSSFILVLLNTAREYAGIFTLLNPQKNPTHPQNLGGFNAMEIISRGEGEPDTNNVELWKSLQAIPGYTVLPVVSEHMWALADMEKAVKEGYKLYLYAPTLDKLRSVPSVDFVQGFTTNGPVVEEFRMEGIVNDPWEHYYMWKPGQIARLHIKVKGDADLKEILLYSGSRVVRSYHPKGREFVVVEEIPMAEDGPFFLTANDVNGKAAYTNAVPTRNANYWNHVGSDRANNYTNPVLPDKYGTMKTPDGTRMGFGGLVTYGYGWGSYLRFYHPVKNETFHPQGFESGRIMAGLSSMRTYPRLASKDTRELDDVALWRNYDLATRDVAVISEVGRDNIRGGRCKPSEFVESYARGMYFRYKFSPYGYVVTRMETRAKIIADKVKLEKKDGPDVGMLELGYLGTKDVRYYTYIDEQGRKQTGDIVPDKLTEPKSFKLGKGGYFVLWPDSFGLLFLYALNDGITVEVGKTDQVYVRAGYNTGGAELTRAREFSADFMIVEEGGGQGPEVCDRLSALWGLNGIPVYSPKVLLGRQLPGGYIVNLEGKGNGSRVRFAVKKFDLPNDILPVTVSGVNPEWSAGALSKKMSFYPGGVLDGRLYLGLEKYAGEELFLGNPLVLDKKGVRLEIAKLNANGVAFALHNPGDASVDVTVSPAEGSGIRHFAKKVHLKAGEILRLNQAF